MHTPADKILKKYPPLSPKKAPWMQDVVQNHALLRKMFGQHGSPINLHHLGPYAENYQAYKSVLDRHDLNHTIFFARKANKCQTFVRAAQRLGFGVDTASYRELKQCLELGCDPDRLVLTAAIKNEPLVRLALKNNVLVILDNVDECRLVNRVAEELGKNPKVGIRISGFMYEGEKLYSRFGFDIDEVAEFITRYLGTEREFCNLQFSGFHFHLNGYSIQQRGAALLQTIHCADKLRKQGISTSFIDIGGGLLMNYLSDKTQWDTFWNELKKAVRGERDPLTFGNNGLGYIMADGELRGEPNVYPFYNETPKDQFLDAVLEFKDDNGQTVASLLGERNIEFRMEPGRSLLDQTGMTLAKVVYRKKDQQENWLVGLEMNRSQLFSSSADFLLDPEFISLQPSTGKKRPTPVYFTGAYCLEQGIILKRKIVVPQLPEVGDIIAFFNTAGYMMHFYETEAHLFELATNLVAETDLSPIKNKSKSLKRTLK